MSSKEPSSLFLASNGEVRQSDLEKITLSLLTYGDKIWLPASFSLSPLLVDEVRIRTARKIESLIEAGLICLWTLEGVQNENVRSADRVIGQNEQSELIEAIDTVVLPATTAVITDRPSNQIDTASRVIETRHELWHLGIAAQCSAPGIVLGGRARSGPGKTLPVGFENLRDRYATGIFDAFRIHSLASLEVRDITDLRHQIIGYRSHIDEILNMEPTITNNEEAIINVCRLEFRKYLQLVDELLRSKAKVGGIDNIYDATGLILEAVGHAIPMGGLLPLSKKFYVWLRDRRRYRFALYMHRLKTVAEDRAAQEGNTTLRIGALR